MSLLAFFLFSLFKSDNSWDRRVRKTDCVKSLRATQRSSMSFHMRAHCTMCFPKLAWRGSESLVLQIRQRKALWNKRQRAGAAKWGFCQVFEKQNCADGDPCLSRENKSLQNECPSWNKRTGTENIASSSACSWSFPASQSGALKQWWDNWNAGIFAEMTENE